MVLPDDLGGFTLEETIHFIGLADDIGLHSVWKQEASGSNGLMTLAAGARESEEIRLGIGVANVFSRTPTLLGMSAATLDQLSGGRALFGLGVSSRPVIETWHGQEFERPLRRLRESIEIVREVTEGGTVHYEGEIFEVGPYSMALNSERVPIYNGAMGPLNRQLTAEFCDGWIPGLVSREHLARLHEEMIENADKAGREPPTVAPWVPTAVDEDPEHARRRLQQLIAREMAMGYNEGMEQYGFRDEADLAFERFRAGDREGAADAIPQEMVDILGVYGTPEDVRMQYERYFDLGADVIVAMPPFSARSEEIEVLIETLGTI
jgi:probable F420-dependent oxidoreductase